MCQSIFCAFCFKNLLSFHGVVLCDGVSGAEDLRYDNITIIIRKRGLFYDRRDYGVQSQIC